MKQEHNWKSELIQNPGFMIGQDEFEKFLAFVEKVNCPSKQSKKPASKS